MKILRFICLFLFCCFVSSSLGAQTKQAIAREGNQLYKEKKYGDAEVKYKKSLAIDNKSAQTQFNLGDAYYKQEKYEEAVQQFGPLATNKDLSATDRAGVNHNLGNAYLQMKKYEEGISAYKNALKLNPQDNDTRYNLAYAQAMMKREEQQQSGQNNKDQKEEQQKEEQQKQGEQNEGEKKEGEQKESQQKQEDQKAGKEQQANRNKISKEDAEKILKSLNNDEKNLQKETVKKEVGKASITKKW